MFHASQWNRRVQPRLDNDEVFVCARCPPMLGSQSNTEGPQRLRICTRILEHFTYHISIHVSHVIVQGSAPSCTFNGTRVLETNSTGWGFENKEVAGKNGKKQSNPLSLPFTKFFPPPDFLLPSIDGSTARSLSPQMKVKTHINDMVHLDVWRFLFWSICACLWPLQFRSTRDKSMWCLEPENEHTTKVVALLRSLYESRHNGEVSFRFGSPRKDMGGMEAPKRLSTFQ